MDFLVDFFLLLQLTVFDGLAVVVRQCFLFDGKEGKVVAELKDSTGSAHESGVMAVSWHQGSRRAITASSDKTVKLWDIEVRACVFIIICLYIKWYTLPWPFIV
jgi:WD40 repeat protein